MVASEDAQIESVHHHEQPSTEGDFEDFGAAGPHLVFQGVDGSQVDLEDSEFAAPHDHSKAGVDDSGINLDPAFEATAFPPIESQDYGFSDIDPWLLNQYVQQGPFPQEMRRQKRAATVSPPIEAPTFAVETPATIPTPPPTNTLPEWAHAWKARENRDDQGRLFAQPRVPDGHCQALMILAPGIVFEWWQAGVAPEDISRLQQYYITVVQMYTMDTLKEILRLRHSAPYHELDHRNIFSGTDGIPPDGWLPPNLTYRYQLGQRHQATYKTNKSHELVEYPSFNEPIPNGSTNATILKHYPNHIKYEFLDSFIQNDITYGQIFRCVEPHIFQLLKNTGIIGMVSASTAENNVFNKRVQKRRGTLAKALYSGPGKFREFLSTPIRIRQTGNLTYYRPHGQKVFSAQDYAIPEPVPAIDCALPRLTHQMPVAASQPRIFSLPSELSGRDEQRERHRSQKDLLDLTSDITTSDESVDTPETVAVETPVRIATRSSPSPMHDSSEVYIRSKDWQIADDVLDPQLFVDAAEQQENDSPIFVHDATALPASSDAPEDSTPSPEHGSTSFPNVQTLPAFEIPGWGADLSADDLRYFDSMPLNPSIAALHEPLDLDLDAADRAAMEAIPIPAGTVQRPIKQPRTQVGKKASQRHPHPSSRKAGKQPRREPDDVDSRIPQLLEAGPKKAKKAAGADTSTTSALMFNPPSAQNANKRRSSSLDEPSVERVDSQMKKVKPITSPKISSTPDHSVPHMQVPGTSSRTSGSLNDFDSRYSTVDTDFARQLNEAYSRFDPGASIDPNALQRTDPHTQIEQPDQHSAAPKPMPQPDIPSSSPMYEDIMQQQNADIWADLMNATASVDGPQVTPDRESPMLTSGYNPFAEHEELFLNPLEQPKGLPHVSGGDKSDEEATEQFWAEQLLNFNNSV